MKNMFESEGVFEAFARIDFGYYLLKDINEQFQELENKRTPIEVMVDESTGYDKKVIETINSAIQVSKRIIADKKLVDADYSYDENFLNRLEKIKFKILNNS